MRGTELDSGATILFQELGVAVVSDVDAVSALAASTSDAESPSLAIEPEYIGRLSATASTEYLRGYRDAVVLRFHPSDRARDARTDHILTGWASYKTGTTGRGFGC